MDVFAAARSLNRRAVQENWHHFCDPTLCAFVDADHEKLLALWRTESWRPPQERPSVRNHATRSRRRYALRNIVIFERFAENPSRYRWRVVGTAVTEIALRGPIIPVRPSRKPYLLEHLARWVTDAAISFLTAANPCACLGSVHLPSWPRISRCRESLSAAGQRQWRSERHSWALPLHSPGPRVLDDIWEDSQLSVSSLRVVSFKSRAIAANFL